MAASITTTGTTLESQLIEVATAMQLAEAVAVAADETFEERVTISPDTDGGTITVSATIPAVITGTAGNLQFAPSEYLP